jgi:hypothetical protein
MNLHGNQKSTFVVVCVLEDNAKEQEKEGQAWSFFDGSCHAARSQGRDPRSHCQAV